MTTLTIKRVNVIPGSPTASTMYILKRAESDLVDIYFTDTTGAQLRHLLTKEEIVTTLNAGNSATATKLATSRTISATGDATWTASFDGSANTTGTLTLSNTGVVAGEYVVTTVDAKGRAIAGRALAVGDVPNLPGSKITGTLTIDTSGNSATATKLATARNINGVAFDGSANIIINAVDATSRIASSEKGVANGVATLAADGKVPASQLPSYVDDVLEYATQAAFPVTGETGKIYVVTSGVDSDKIYRWSGTIYIEISASAGTSDSATKLATARTIAMTGDGTWSVSFDGSGNVTASLVLANTGITAGGYGYLTVDAKGRALTGRALLAADIPSLDYTKVTSAAGIDITADW